MRSQVRRRPGTTRPPNNVRFDLLCYTDQTKLEQSG